MATARKNQQPETPQAAAPTVAGIGLAVGVALLWFGYPGATLIWLMVTVAAWVAPPAVFTGKKDASGYATPAHPGERAAMQRYRFWADLKWRMIIPTASLAPGWPPYAAWVFGLLAAAGAWALPHEWHLARHLDAAATFILVTQVAAARRKTVAVADVSPGVRLDALAKAREADNETLIPGAAAVVLGGGAGSYLTGAWLPAPPLPGLLGDVYWWILGALLGAGAGGARWWVEASLSDWRELVAARAEWEPRWQMLKHDPAPFLIRREHVGSAVVDTFAAPGSMGAMAYWPLGPKIAPTTGAGQRLAVLSVPNTDSQDQPVLGTRHPLNFQVVTWPADALPDMAALDTAPEVASLFIQCAVVWACDATGYARPILSEVQPLGIAAAPAGGLDTGGSADDGGDEPPASAAPTAPGTQAWGTTWLLPDGPPFVHLRTALLGDISAQLGCEVLVDHRNEVLYAGALTTGTTEFDPQFGIDGEAMRLMSVEDTWNDRWAEVMKQGVNPPTIQHPTYAEAALANGATVRRQAFTTRRGVDPQEFFGLEPKIAATLDGAPYVAVCGWASRGRIGERHPQAFTVYWSHDPVPANPDTLPPAQGRTDAPQWVLSGRINDAFKAARLAKPEVYDVRCLTTPRSRGHIWQMKLRLYGGVTLADVRGAAQRLRQHLGSEWLRVEAAKDGCVLVAGAAPGRVQLASPDRDTAYLAALDWEQAWLDVKMSGVGGLTPKLVGVGHLPHNDMVQVLDFELPSGLSVGDVRAVSAKLGTATANAFIDVRESPDGKADKMRVLACEVNPLSERVAFDFDVVDEISGIPFATGVEGEPIVFDPLDSPHALLAGVTGAGKSVLAANFLYGFLAHGAEVYVIDPVKGGADFQFAKPYARAFADNPFQAAGVMKAVYAEVVRRKTLNAQHGVGSYRDLPEPPRPIVVMIDEFTSLMGQSPVPKPSDDPEIERERALLVADNAARVEVGVIAGKLAREARSAGVTLLLGTQKLTAKMLDTIPGGMDLKTNLARVLLGKASYGDRASALRAFDSAPMLDGAIPKGRGLWESLTTSAVVIQCWYAPQEVMAENLGHRVAPIPEDERLDVSQFVAPEPDVDGAVIGPGPSRIPATATVAEPDQVIELDAIELSLDDLEMSLDDTDEQAVPAADPAVDEDGRDTDATVPPVFDWDAAEAAARDSEDDDEPDDDLDWPEVPADPTRAPQTVPDEWLTETRTVPDPATEQTAAEEPPDVPADGIEVGEHVVWDEIDPSPWEPAESQHGWSEIDAVLAFLTDFPEVRSLTWTDAHLADEDDMGVTFAEVVSDLLAARGVNALGPQFPSPAPADGDLPEDQRDTPAASCAADPTDPDDDDDFTLPKVAAHLIPDDDPFG
ncbi:FtsK/SpoIIIE domain-containing protein [Nocardioides pakistanensis]